MPSVKSYRNRKRDIAALNIKLANEEYQNRKLQEELNVYKNALDKLGRELQHYMNTVLDVMSVQMPSPIIVQNTGKQEIESLKKEVEALKITLRLYREYILKTYQAADFVELVDIPKCLKPLDSVKYVGEKCGLNNQS